MTYADALEQRLVAAGHDPMAVSLLVYGADDVTERLALAPADLAAAYVAATTLERRPLPDGVV